MSWSNTWIGRRAGIKAAMARYSNTLTGNSKEEFEQARPHLEGLLDLNFNEKSDQVVQLDANGHAYRSDGNSYSQVSVTLRQVGSLCEDPADTVQPAAASV
jgi:hypothetical protein